MNHRAITVALVGAVVLVFGFGIFGAIRTARPAELPVVLPPVTVTAPEAPEDPCEAAYACFRDGKPVPPAGADPFGQTWEDLRYIGRGDRRFREDRARYA